MSWSLPLKWLKWFNSMSLDFTNTQGEMATWSGSGHGPAAAGSGHPPSGRGHPSGLLRTVLHMLPDAHAAAEAPCYFSDKSIHSVPESPCTGSRGSRTLSQSQGRGSSPLVHEDFKCCSQDLLYFIEDPKEICLHGLYLSRI